MVNTHPPLSELTNHGQQWTRDWRGRGSVDGSTLSGNKSFASTSRDRKNRNRKKKGVCGEVGMFLSM
jgi:hypothetical protein